MLSAHQIKAKLEKQWQQCMFQKAYLNDEQLFPYHFKIAKLSQQRVMHQYAEFQAWQQSLSKALANIAGVDLIQQEVSYSKIGRQLHPVSVDFKDMQALARYLGKWQRWQLLAGKIQLTKIQLPVLSEWLLQNPGEVENYLEQWPKLINVCLHMQRHPQPNVYIRQLNIAGIDSKFIEQHKGILKILLDICLAAKYINQPFTKLKEHGFEKRFGFRYDQPLVRMRILDPVLADEFGGVSDISMPIEEFMTLDLLLDRVFITENKVNFLVFPALKNALVIFGVGYGVQLLQQSSWLAKCQIHYWGDIDTHGLAILSQFRGYFAHTKAMLTDQQTLLSSREHWGEEPPSKTHRGDKLDNLNEAEQQLYQDLKQHRWQKNIRLEQEYISYQLVMDWLEKLK